MLGFASYFNDSWCYYCWVFFIFWSRIILYSLWYILYIFLYVVLCEVFIEYLWKEDAKKRGNLKDALNKLGWNLFLHFILFHKITSLFEFELWHSSYKSFKTFITIYWNLLRLNVFKSSLKVLFNILFLF